jgi:hypothetical protein
MHALIFALALAIAAITITIAALQLRNSRPPRRRGA